MKFTTALYALLLSATIASAQSAQTPAGLYGDLFAQVQQQRLFPDGKTFVDAVPRSAPDVVMAEYERRRRDAQFDLKSFVLEHFEVPQPVDSGYRSDLSRDVVAHIDELWSVLTRQADRVDPYSSLLPLPQPYVVPGGRFREIYYWDSYFTMLGLEQSGRHELTLDMLANFAHLIDRYGHVPNGNRTYYLSRSQPPFFAAMVELAAARDGEQVYVRFRPQLQREYEFWMEGAGTVGEGAAHRRVVRLPDGSVLNRYWDDQATPRDESYAEDVATAAASGRRAAEVYRNLRAAAESGWDFSSRWLRDGRTLTSIRTVEIVPVDLNSLLYQLERTLARAHRVAGDSTAANTIEIAAAKRRQAMRQYLWNADEGAFGDYAWRQRTLTPHVTAATLFPLYFGIADVRQSAQVATFVQSHLLQPDGLATTMERTGQQWDAPNGWAPLQWIAIKSLRDRGQPALAQEIACRWIRENTAAFAATGKLVEKYDVSGEGAAGGGEYPLQDGFGWTNGVLRALLALYSPQDCASRLH
ncbi:MAG TPA: alpha,alpha-trehalase TreF [Povalibacter sp.]|uniref:alpha,alpha-trehalase TreF n=1 Tax=Povalibacter sp. TaxID=1962978 RepID=UPI002BA850BE|nr:alpha,alpha-trehalase TreF [Povalibacter sp.]HMN43010.1 alpha,alpha-trehalase TreF [Povalibacter sp.]